MKKILTRIWNITLSNGSTAKVATLEQGPRKKTVCEGCVAPCCRGVLSPVLTSEEFLKKKFPVAFKKLEPWLQEQIPTADCLAVLDTNDGCPYLDKATNKCKIFPDCPKSCLAYDCTEDPRPEIATFAKAREAKLKRNK